ncbi:MAG: DUF5131 family protein [Deltaproteobacteria bacterium]|nr:DUF5131 family protein [Deltaproteobacteria bacterium]MBW2363461.1 DUF5131 family protein [Deltaproteobacteria bacterium]
MNKTNIEYLDYTWNPLVMRCSPISTGCANCWHLVVADRLAVNPTMSRRRQNAYKGSIPYLAEKELTAPGKRKKPSIVGVQFMGDLFHLTISYKLFEKIMFEIGEAYWHTFIVLTKRPNRMRSFIERYYGAKGLSEPLSNLWLGVSCSVQKDAMDYIPILANIQAAKKFVSFEPLLDSITFPFRHDLDWVIAGCESGSVRRKTVLSWFRHLRDQCVAFDIPFFLKQREVSGKVVKMPILDSKVWDQWPITKGI